MCNLYSMTRNREAILRLFRVSHNRAAAYEPRDAIFPGYQAPVVRKAADGERELAVLNASHMSGHSISQRRQRERWLGGTSASGGIAAEHSGSTSAQRGANAQPGSGSSGLATCPGIAFSRRLVPAIANSSSDVS